MPPLILNRARTTLAAGIAAGDLSCTVAAGTGAEFVHSDGTAPSTTRPVRVMLYAAAADPLTATVEYCDVVGRSTDTLTLANRGSEGSTAAAWSTGDVIVAVLTSATVEALQPVAPVRPVSSSGVSRLIVPGVAITGTASRTLINGALYCVPFVAQRDFAFDRVHVRCATAAAGSHVRFGLGTVSKNLRPTTLLADWGTQDTATTGDKDYTVSESHAPGRYCLLVGVSGSTPTLTVGNGILLDHTMWLTFASGAIRDHYVSGGYSGAAFPSDLTTVFPDGGPAMVGNGGATMDVHGLLRITNTWEGR